MSKKARRQHALDVLPLYATQCRIAAKRCFRALCCLIALDQPGSVEVGQDMLHKRCLQGGKITATPMRGWGEVNGDQFVRLVFSNEPVERLATLRERINRIFPPDH